LALVVYFAWQVNRWEAELPDDEDSTAPQA